jgi:hypothetical protein
VYCTGMVTRVAIIGALAVMLALSSASAQESRPAGGSATLELKRDAKPRPIVRPEADPGQATRDAAGAAAEYEQKQRDEAVMREQARPAVRRPDLGYDVTSGIQQRNIQRK